MSCQGFLETEPLSFTAVDNFYKSASDAETALRGCYSRVLNSYSVGGRGGIFYVADIGTDELIGNPYSTPDAGSNMDQFIFGRVVKSNINMRDTWSAMYNSIYAINNLLGQLPGITMEEGQRKRIEAEASFLRGWHYFYMGMMFGGVPLYTAVPHHPEQARSSLEEVMNQAIADLRLAYDRLPDETVSTPGMATKWAAAGYLAKLYCYLASSKISGTGRDLQFELNSYEWVPEQEFYQKAEILLEEIVTKSGLKLTRDYRTLFLEGAREQQREELLFTFLPSDQMRVGFGLNYYLLPVGYYGNGWGTCRPTYEAFARYDTLLDARAKWVLGGMGTEATVLTIEGKNYTRPTELKLANGVPYDGDYNITKFRMISSAVRSTDVYLGYYPLLRLADIYLLWAEARANSQGAEAGREILKTVRSRALRTGSAENLAKIQARYRKTDFIEELLDERSRELGYEQQRKFDLVRFNRYLSTIKSLSTTVGVWNGLAAGQLKNNLTPHQIWMPIPEEDEIINANLLPNNPGY
ncbi:RagB/SusD family nutrient uptake outer membrane protein [Ravibacter arvi]|uniref:RagB/SusD family nutrient uptake outer membrane protein n=2 Tax=Ravibacter arvi TaxID=2051041 RepID=A0ABP8LP52_9BACT